MALAPYIITVITKQNAPFNVVPNAPIEIRARLSNGTSGGLSLIYSDQAGASPITQAGATADSNGQFVFYAEAAEYNAVYQSQTVPVDMGLTPSTLPSALINDITQAHEFTTLQSAIDFTRLVVSKVCHVAEYTVGNGGGGVWDTVLTSTVTPNATTIVQSAGVPTLSLVYRPSEDARSYSDIASAKLSLDLTVGEKFITVGNLAALYIVSSGGTVDDIDVFLLNNNSRAIRITSLAGDQYYSHKQRSLFFEQMKYLREDGVFKFNWYGDSNSVRDNNQAQLSFIYALEQAYGSGKAIVQSNRGQSGASAKTLFNLFTTKSAVNISIFNCGTNDASTQDGYPSVGNIKQYEYWLEQLIIREISWGNPCVFVTPLPVRFDKAWEKYNYAVPTDLFPSTLRVDAFQMAGVMRRLGAKYSIPVIDSAEIIAPFRDTAYANAGGGSIDNGVAFGDVVHLETAYLGVWGDGIARQFIGNLVGEKVEVKSGSRLTIRKFYDPISISSARDYQNMITYAQASTETAMAYGDFVGGNRAISLSVAGERITWSFYCTEDNTIVFPMLYLAPNSEINILADSGNILPSALLDPDFDFAARLGDSSLTINMVSGGAGIVNRTPQANPLQSKAEENNYFRLNNRGWHTMSITVVSGEVLASGLSFEDEGIVSLVDSIIDFNSPLNLLLAGNGRMMFAQSGTVALPSGVTTAYFKKYESKDMQRGIVNLYEDTPTQGTAYVILKTAGVWGPWVAI
tara:strand:- start:46 stop:2271 length:2226 start_codon:yes stop_codon:yes gene_type:complete